MLRMTRQTRSNRCAAALTMLTIISSRLFADEPSPPPGPTVEQVRAAVAQSLPLLEAGAKGSLEQRARCFTCHNQGLPIMALSAAQVRGFTVDNQHLRRQVQHTADFLGKNRAQYLEGKGQGGQIDTAGYALWTLAIAGWQPDGTTAAVAEYFLIHQREADHYQPTSRRPPSEQSHFTSSFVALRGMKSFGTAEQQPRIEERIAKVREWLFKTPPQDTEDRVFRLRALHAAGAANDEIRRARDELLTVQRPDGGWSQLADLASDAYATGSVLVALHEAGGLPTDDAAYRRGLAYLIANQQRDGSWHVVSRAKPFQTYFESGYPHGKDQFISCAAAGWATTALALSLPLDPELPPSP